MITDQNTSTTKVLPWTWITQRSLNDAAGKAVHQWQFGFVATDGADLRITLHQTNTAEAEKDAIFYVTFFCNRAPESFTKWDTSLSNEESLSVWVTITHGILDFIRKSSAKNVVFDDLANGKLKMVLRNLCLDLVDANPEYELEQTKRSHFKTFYQVKRKDAPSAFDDQVAGTSAEGETAMPVPPDQKAAPEDETNPAPGTPPVAAQAPPPDPTTDPKAVAPTAPAPPVPDTSTDATKPLDGVPGPRTDLVIEIGRDYSVTARNRQGMVVDRHMAKNPADVIRWIAKKGFSGCKMKIVPKALAPLTGDAALEADRPVDDPQKIASKFHECAIIDNRIIIHRDLTAHQAAVLNGVVGADTVLKLEEGIAFEWPTTKNMKLKQHLLQLALQEITPVLP